jgi:hypothetical protein
LGSKYLDRAPSGLRIVILSKGSCLYVELVILCKFRKENFVKYVIVCECGYRRVFVRLR